MGFIFGGGNASKSEAKAIKETAADQAASDREAARGAELTQETMLAQDRASRSAAELLSKPQGTPEVDLQDLGDTSGIRDSYGILSKDGSSTPSGGSSSGSSSSGGSRQQRFPVRRSSGGIRI